MSDKEWAVECMDIQYTLNTIKEKNEIIFVTLHCFGNSITIFFFLGRSLLSVSVTVTVTAIV